MVHEKSDEIASQGRIEGQEKSARFFVLSAGGGQWLIYREGVMNPIENQPRKLLAVENAKALARLETPSEVLVEQRNGTFKVQYACPPRVRVLQA